MADIDIQEKKGGSMWPWVIGLLALLLAVWAAMALLGDDEDDVVVDPASEELYAPLPAPTDAANTAVPMEVTQFEQQCASASMTAMSTDHTYINSCVTQMTAALNAVVQRDTVNGSALAPQLEEYRARAERLTQNAESLEHSTYVQQVFEGAASLIASVEQARGTAGGGTALQDAASAVSTSQPVLDQKDAITAFFSQAAAALRSLATI